MNKDKKKIGNLGSRSGKQESRCTAGRENKARSEAGERSGVTDYSKYLVG